ncbi:hypothetical protein BU23DRAFT_550769, partial [Bimuria novae-zelandiae CBS 107.79]
MLKYLRRQGVGRACQKVVKERFSSSLMRLKTQFIKHMEWGEIRWDLSKSGEVVLFTSTIAEPIQVIMKLRRRSKISQNNKGIFEKAFSNEPVRLLGIPQIINNYNYYKTKQPLLYFLLNLTLNNAYKLSLYSNAAAAKRSGYKRFLYDLIKLDNVVVAKESSHRSANLYKQAKTCVLCAERGRRQHKSQPPKVALGHVQGNLQSPRPPQRTP